MKTFTLSEFEALAARDDWSHEQSLNTHGEMHDKTEGTDIHGEFDLIDKTTIYGEATVTSTLDDITITYHEGYNYDVFAPENLDSGTEGMQEIWTLEGARVVDEDGDELSEADWACALGRTLFDRIDYSSLLTRPTNDIDLDEASDMETFTLKIDNAPSIRFTGELVAEVDNSSSSSSSGRWTELALYKTKGGKYVCHHIACTNWVNQQDRYRGEVCENLDQVRDFFGHKWLSKELYDRAGIEDVVDVE
jgi:hypothetical protein